METPVKEKTNILKEYWSHITFAVLLILSLGKMLNVVTQLESKVQELSHTIERLDQVRDEKLEKETNRLDEEDNGVRGDMERAIEELKSDLKEQRAYEDMRERAIKAELKVYTYEH